MNASVVCDGCGKPWPVKQVFTGDPKALLESHCCAGMALRMRASLLLAALFTWGAALVTSVLLR